MAKTMRVGALLGTGSGYGREALAGVSRYASEAGWDLVIHWGFGTDIMENIASWQGEGVIAQTASPEWIHQALARELPVVQISSAHPVAEAVRVTADDYAIGKMAAGYLLTLELPSYAFWGVSETYYFSERRKAGFVDAMRAAGVEPRVEHLPGANFQPALAEVVSSLSTRAGIFAASDSVARTLIRTLRAQGRKVPDDMAILGVDNDVVEQCLAGVELTSIDVGFDRVGYRAAEILDHLMGGGAPPAAPILLPPVRVVERKSTDTLATDDALVTAAMQYMRQNAGRPLRVEGVAEALDVSRRSLQRRFQAELGRSPQKQVLLVHIERARRLLAGTQYSIADVAIKAGFADARTMAAAFRKLQGQTPSSYRKAMQHR